LADDIIFGAILAGGEGRRIGGRKALVEIACAPLIARVAAPLRAGVSKLCVIGDSEASTRLGAEAIADSPGVPRGPLSGIASGLSWATRGGADWLAVAPCDTPFLPFDFVTRLHAAATNAGAAIACARTADGVHPLVSLWRVTIAKALTHALFAEPYPAAHSFVAERGAAYETFAATDLMNVNTNADLAVARRLIEQ
jgi:molybdenum cofactor guanylyltransferase